MKQLVVITLAMLALIVPFGRATAQEIEWAKEVPGHPYYSEVYHLKGKDCFVNVHADGKGITLVARTRPVPTEDPSLAAGNLVLIVQQVDIRQNGSFKTVNDRRFSTALEALWDHETNQVFIVQSSYFEDPLAPDSFSTCSEETRALPEKVKAFFLGEYGLGKPLPLKSKQPTTDDTRENPRVLFIA